MSQTVGKIEVIKGKPRCPFDQIELSTLSRDLDRWGMLTWTITRGYLFCKKCNSMFWFEDGKYLYHLVKKE